MSFLVTVITPSYNSSQFIEHTIQSIQNQTYKNWELLIIDDCSIDKSREVIQSYVNKDSRIKMICLEQNSGAAVARNTGIKNASGRFIAFLDSDDTWYPKKLEKQLNFMLEHNYAFTYTQYHQVNEHGEKIGELHFPDRTDYYSLLKTCVIGCLTAMYDTHKLGKVYFPLIRKRQDFGLWLKILKMEPYAYCVPEDLASYTVRSDSISANKFKAAQYNWHLYRHIEQLSLMQSIYYFSQYAIRGILRNKFKRLSKLLNL
ncbi:glycosyltransferase family 2 protein [Acinetobacter sp. YH01009]|uniref:glycosyltransferase family 2 protein n=1 Tax=Acinetobacter sp. YH01009 TaxID=2601025 RepID=UPI0015D247D3|nr:glycosyltransferase family 2 protein [Acinetobacter sp. YH01009]